MDRCGSAAAVIQGDGMRPGGGKQPGRAAKPLILPQYLQYCSRMLVISLTISSTSKTISIMLICSS